jgi:hypothetical protein
MSLFSRRQALGLFEVMGLTTSWAGSSALVISRGDNLPEFQGIQICLNGCPFTNPQTKRKCIHTPYKVRDLDIINIFDKFMKNYPLP